MENNTPQSGSNNLPRPLMVNLIICILLCMFPAITLLMGWQFQTVMLLGLPAATWAGITLRQWMEWRKNQKRNGKEPS